MAATCCARLSKLYMLTTNLLVACLGVAFIAFGVIGFRDGFKGAILFPPLIFKLIAILGAIIVLAALLGIAGAFKHRKGIIIVYMIIVVIALVFQVVIGVKVYQKGANTASYLAPLWSTGTNSFRETLQNEFECCGYNNAMDQPAVTDKCNPSSGQISTQPPCYDTLNQYAHMCFTRVYLVLFAALAVELLALTNGITILCTRAIHGDPEEEEERRRRRKSGIRLDDMSPDTPTTAGSHNQYGNYYQGGGGGMYEDKYQVSGDSRYDSYDIYKQNNAGMHGGGRYY